MAKTRIEVINGVPHYLTEGENGQPGTIEPIGGTHTNKGTVVPEQALRLMEQQRAMAQGVVPKGSGDVLLHPSKTDQIATWGPVGRSLASIPGEVRDIYNTPSPLADKYPLLGPGSPALSRLFTHFIQESPGVIESAKDFENNPLRAASDIYQTAQGIKGAVGLAKALPSVLKGGKDAIVRKLIESRAGLNEPQVPYSLNALEVPATDAMQTAQNLFKQGVNTPLTAIGEASERARAAFANSKVGQTALRETQEGISNLIRERGKFTGAATSGIAEEAELLPQISAEIQASIPQLLEKGRESLTPALQKSLADVGTQNMSELVWKEIAKNSSRSEGNILDAKKLVDYVSKNGKNIKEFIGPEGSVALQEFAHGLKRTQDLGAIKPTSLGFRIMQEVLPAGIGTTATALGVPGVGKAIAGYRGAKAVSTMALNSESFAKLLADKEGKWILARMAGKKSTDPSLRADMQKLAALAGKIGVAVNINTGSGAGPQKATNE